jgi:hypothetical protein
MAVTDEQVAALRAYLAARSDAETDEAQQLIQRLGRPGVGNSIAALVYATFVIAARRRFSPTWTHAEVIRYVAGIRELLSERPDALDARAAEHQLYEALGERQARYPDEEAQARAQVVLLDALIQSAELDDAGVADLLAEGRRLADDLPNRHA